MTLKEELAAAPLGHATDYPDTYDAALLFAVPRAPQRAEIGIGADLPFAGADVWNAYELTWLDPRGKPAVAIASFTVPATSPAIVESKSVKLYLGSFAQSRFAASDAVAAAVARDIGAAVGTPVAVNLVSPAEFARQSMAQLNGTSIDDAGTGCEAWEVDAGLLAAGGPPVAETLTSDLFRSVCPVTGQPDYASIAVAYCGPRIYRAALLRYLVSYRQHAGFHEHCVERIFVDVKAVCRCDALTVHARFTRRGGVDINPFRSDAGDAVPANVRTPRQ
ncbi:MAG: NADPH-dependent 7-cyano-7-deazaguanine reductase QueF [Burkholderiales bacterium]